MSDWLEFTLALAVFFLSHALPVRPPVKPWLVARLGARGFALAYSVLSLAILIWLVGAAGRAPHVALWYHAPWQSHLALALMLPACLLLSVGAASVNPLSFGGRSGRFDPAAPGIAGLARHPLLLAILLWALAHLAANGTLAQALLFGLFAAFAGFGMRLIDRRRQAEWGRERWAETAHATALFPFAALVAGRWTPRGAVPVLPLLAGLALYVVLIMLHRPVIGVSPLP
ncbi:MAG: NnrU family protein [Pararhodobacter sp.]